MGGVGLSGRCGDGTGTLTVRVLGRFRVEHDREAVELPVQAQRVVGYLAVLGSSERRDRLAGRLWPFSPQRRADANLRTALWRIGASAPGLLDASRLYVALHDHVGIDLREATSAAKLLIDNGDSDPMDLDGLWTDDLLPGWDEDWLVVERERSRQLRIHGLESLSRNHREHGRLPAAIDAALAAIAAEPLRESAHAELIKAHIAEGNMSEAQRQLRTLEQLLQRELGISTSPAMRDLVARECRRRDNAASSRSA